MAERIAVDLDGTVIRSDLLWESAIRHLLGTPFGWARMMTWLAAGPAALKTRLAEHVELDPSLLPYKAEVIERLQRAHADGAEIVLATAAAERYAYGIAQHLGIFSGVLATRWDGPNLQSAIKASHISEWFGSASWSYVGDSRKDLHVWARSTGAVAVDSRRRVMAALGRIGIPVEHVRTSRAHWLPSWLRQLRVHHWTKNLLVFVPLLTSHQLLDATALWHSVLAFVSFSLMASSVYIWNDLADLSSDRRHPHKRNRPLASGVIPIPAAIAVGSTLGVLAAVLAVFVGWLFLVALLGYVVATNLYSLWLKHKPMVDATALAMLYTWRIVAGCAALSVQPSVWLIAFSAFFFFDLALMKRYAELFNYEGDAPGRGYSIRDLNLIMALGVGSGLISVLVGVMYINSPNVVLAYSMPQVLWAAAPLLMYWIARTWMVTIRGEMNDDPLVFAARDRISILVFASIGIIWAVATVL